MSKKHHKEAAPAIAEGGLAKPNDEVRAVFTEEAEEFQIGEPAIFRMAGGAGITVKIMRGPQPGKRKYAVEFPGGAIVPVEPRLLEK